MTYLELINLKNVSMLQFEELKRKTTEVERKQLMDGKEYQRTLQHLQAQLERGYTNRRRVWIRLVSRKDQRIMNICYNTIP